VCPSLGTAAAGLLAQGVSLSAFVLKLPPQCSSAGGGTAVEVAETYTLADYS
jgi:hypothetical protein